MKKRIINRINEQIRLYSIENQRNLTFEEFIGTIQDDIQIMLKEPAYAQSPPKMGTRPLVEKSTASSFSK